MQRRLLDAEREMISNFLKLHMTLTDCGLAATPLLATKMLVHNTTDGLPYVEPPLTDEDARARPWVMVRDADTNPWNGPFIFICKTKERWGFAVTQPDFCELQSFRYARRATDEEIAAAGLEVAE